MRATAPILTFLILATALAGAPSAAQTPLPEAGLEREVRQLNATLGELVELLEQQLESTNAAVLMQRVQLMASRIAPLEEELREARSEQQGFEAGLDEMELSAASFEASVERDLQEDQISAEQARNLMDQQLPIFEQRKKQLEERLWSVRQRVIDLEQRLDARRTEIETWEGEIDRVLGLR